MPHGEVMEGDREKKRIKGVRAVRDGFSLRRVAAGGRHQLEIRIRIKIKKVFGLVRLT